MSEVLIFFFNGVKTDKYGILWVKLGCTLGKFGIYYTYCASGVFVTSNELSGR